MHDLGDGVEIGQLRLIDVRIELDVDTPEPEIIGEDELIISPEDDDMLDVEEDELRDELVFVVDQAEFEKDYEVK